MLGGGGAAPSPARQGGAQQAGGGDDLGDLDLLPADEAARWCRIIT